jgi:hypothetical protein
MSNDNDSDNTPKIGPQEMQRIREACNFVSLTWDEADPTVLEGNVSLALDRYGIVDPVYEQGKAIERAFRETMAKTQGGIQTAPPVAGTRAPQSPDPRFGSLVEDASEQVAKARAEGEGEHCGDPDCLVHHPKPGSN